MWWNREGGLEDDMEGRVVKGSGDVLERMLCGLHSIQGKSTSIILLLKDIYIVNVEIRLQNAR